MAICIIVLLSLCGCKKTYTCECIQVSVPEGSIGDYKIKAKSRSEAERICDDKTTYTTNTIPQMVDVQCTLK